MSKKSNLYFGRAGQLLVMSKFLNRGWNVAIPEVDVGDDIFVVHDENNDFFRIQVKLSNVKSRKYGSSGTFNLNLKQLSLVYPESLYFVLVLQIDERKNYFIIINKEKLKEYIDLNNIGTKFKNNIVLNFQLKKDKLFCSNIEFSSYLNNWDIWPIISH